MVFRPLWILTHNKINFPNLRSTPVPNIIRDAVPIMRAIAQWGSTQKFQTKSNMDRARILVTITIY